MTKNIKLWYLIQIDYFFIKNSLIYKPFFLILNFNLTKRYTDGKDGSNSTNEVNRKGGNKWAKDNDKTIFYNS